MNRLITMQNQIRNKIRPLFNDDQKTAIDDLAQNIVSLILVTVFLATSIVW